MKATILILRLAIGCIISYIATGCVSTYKPMQLGSLPIDDYWNAMGDSGIEIAMEYDVLTEPGAKKYARAEKKNNVSLVLLSIRNAGQQEITVAQDFVFVTDAGESILPLTIEEALESLAIPATAKENDNLVEVEMDVSKTMDLIWGGNKMANMAKTTVSHVRLANDMQAYYLENRLLSPGMYLKGILVLPVKKETPMTISLR